MKLSEKIRHCPKHHSWRALDDWADHAEKLEAIVHAAKNCSVTMKSIGIYGTHMDVADDHYLRLLRQALAALEDD